MLGRTFTNIEISDQDKNKDNNKLFSKRDIQNTDNSSEEKSNLTITPNKIEVKHETQELKKLYSCNILWYGEPCDRKTVYEKTKRTGTIIEHGIANIQKMSDALVNPINFWCPEEYENLYKKRFDQMGLKDKVAVCAIERCVKKHINDEDSIIKDSANFILTLIKNINRNKIIDLITIKDVFAIFLLAVQGGYTLDTNVFPTREKFSLPAFNNFCSPQFNGRPDCWMMFSPPGNTKIKDALKCYMTEWNDIQNNIHTNREYKNDWLYHQHLAEALISALKIPYEEMSSDDISMWEIIFGNNESPMINLPIVKHFNNTHKPDMFKDVSWNSWLINDDVTFFKDRLYLSLEDLKFMLEKSKKMEKQPMKCISYFTEAIRIEKENKPGYFRNFRHYFTCTMGGIIAGAGLGVGEKLRKK